MIGKIFGNHVTDYKLAFTGTAAQQALEAGHLYEFVGTEDFHMHFIEPGGTAADTDNYLYKAGIPYSRSIDFDSTETAVSVISAGTNGNLHIAKLRPGSIK